MDRRHTSPRPVRTWSSTPSGFVSNPSVRVPFQTVPFSPFETARDLDRGRDTRRYGYRRIHYGFVLWQSTETFATHVHLRAMMATRVARLRPIKADRRCCVRVVAQEREVPEPLGRKGTGNGPKRAAAAVAVAATVFAMAARPARATTQAPRCVCVTRKTT